MKLVVGLGNPGAEYENTRHNTGRIMVGMIEGKLKQKIKFLMPDNFMNNSGPAVAKALAGSPAVASAKAGKKSLKDLIVIYDDLDLPLGKMKISFNRSAGGHRGLASIIKALKSEEFLRIRVGIAPATPSGKIKKPVGEKAVINFILGQFKKSELDTLKKLSKKVAEAVGMIFSEGKEKTMSVYN